MMLVRALIRLLLLAAPGVLLSSCGGGGIGSAPVTAVVCPPASFGALGDATTDNTAAIQSAIDSCATQGGGLVELSKAASGAVYVTGPIVLKSHVHLQIDAGVTLQATNDHSRYVPAFINWVYRPNEALISAKGATDVSISGGGTIDGAGDVPDPKDGNRTWHEVGAAENENLRSTRPWILEFYQCDHVSITGVTLQHQPYWTQALRYSSDITESHVTIDGVGRNSDGVDLVGVTNATLSDLDISVSDDDIAVKSGLPISPSDYYYAQENGLPELPTSHVLIKNINARAGSGISIGSEAVNGIHDVTLENINLTNTRFGFRIKSGRDRGSQIFDINVKHLVMTGGGWPFAIDSYYSTVGPDPSGPAQPITPTTPHVHDINVEDFTATGATGESYIIGLPESCVLNVMMNGVSIETTGFGLHLMHMTGTFTDVTSTPAPPRPPYWVDENVTVRSVGSTPAIAPTPPLAGQNPCG